MGLALSRGGRYRTLVKSKSASVFDVASCTKIKASQCGKWSDGLNITHKPEETKKWNGSISRVRKSSIHMSAASTTSKTKQNKKTLYFALFDLSQKISSFVCGVRCMSVSKTSNTAEQSWAGHGICISFLPCSCLWGLVIGRSTRPCLGRTNRSYKPDACHHPLGGQRRSWALSDDELVGVSFTLRQERVMGQFAARKNSAHYLYSHSWNGRE